MIAKGHVEDSFSLHCVPWAHALTWRSDIHERYEGLPWAERGQKEAGTEAGAMLTGKMLDGGLDPHFWTVRGRGEGEDSWSRALTVTQGLLSIECPLRAPHCANGNNNYVH